MIRTTRNIVVATGVFCFVATVLQATALAHLLGCEHSEDHDEHHCDICLSASALQKQVIVECEHPIRKLQILAHSPEFFPIEREQQFIPLRHGPRAPPTVS